MMDESLSAEQFKDEYEMMDLIFADCFLKANLKAFASEKLVFKRWLAARWLKDGVRLGARI